MIKAPLLMVITDETIQKKWTHVQLARMALEGGADVIQYREKRSVSYEEKVQVAKAIQSLCDQHQRKLVINDDVKLAAELGVGVHLGKNDVNPTCAKKVPGIPLLGYTVNSEEDVEVANMMEVDYVGLGPVFGTSSKANAPLALGIERTRRMVEACKHPVIAIGGIALGNVSEVVQMGAHGVAVLSEVCCADDPASATHLLKEGMMADA